MSETLESYCEYYKRPCTVSDGLCSECGERLIEPASGATEESPKTKGMTNGKQRVEEILQKYSNAVVDEAVEKCVGGGIVVFAERAKAKRLEALDSIEEVYKVTGETSDGYHTFNELYDFRKAYNALLFNEWACAMPIRFDVHKSWKHSDGELAFGGGWFVVVAETPMGQITNHYEEIDWDKFQVPEKETANEWDGHTAQEALNRLIALTAIYSPAKNQPNRGRWESK